MEIFFGRSIAKGALLSATSKFVGLLRCHVIDVSLSFSHKLDCVLVELVEVIRGVERSSSDIRVGPTIDQPMHIGHDGINVLSFLFRRIGVVHSNVTDAVELMRDPEVQADRLGVTNMKISVRFRRKTRDNLAVFSSTQVIRYNVADKIRWNISFRHMNARR